MTGEPVQTAVMEFYAECPACVNRGVDRVVYHSDVRWDFCPVCGSRMDVVETEVKPLGAA